KKRNGRIKKKEQNQKRKRIFKQRLEEELEESTNEKVANYVKGLDLSCGISWASAKKIFCPFRLKPRTGQKSTHYFFGILDFEDKTISVHDSMGSVPYDRAIEHVRIYARLIPHCLKCLNFGEHNKYNGQSPVEKFNIMWMNTPQQANSVDCGIFALKYIDLRLNREDVFNFDQSQSLTFKRELAANLWAHGKWKKDSGYETPKEQQGHDYGDFEETLCEFFD
ncbi:hypothetical protein A4A49_59430, partial [Nicotiana attenuata]